MSTEATHTNEHDDEDAAFAAGFDHTPTEPATAASAGSDMATTQEATTATSAASHADDTGTETTPAADPFGDLPPAVRDLLAKIPVLENQTNEAMQRARTAEGRAGALQSRLDKMNQSTAATEAPAKSRFEKVQALRDQGLPEIADAIEELAEHAIPARQEARTEAVDMATPQTGAEEESDPQVIALNIARPTWWADVESADFKLWLTTQPAEYQQRVQSTGQAKDLLSALEAFDQRKKPAGGNTTRTTRMAAGLTHAGDGRRTAPRGRAEELDEDAAMEAGFSSVRR